MYKYSFELQLKNFIRILTKQDISEKGGMDFVVLVAAITTSTILQLFSLFLHSHLCILYTVYSVYIFFNFY